MKNFLTAGLVVSTLVLLLAAQATAGIIHMDNFTAQVNPGGVVTGGGSGWDGGRFVYYPASGWYNEWFYNDPPKPEPQWKWITYAIDAWPGTAGDTGQIEIAINYSTLGWPPTGPDGPPPGGIVPLTLEQEQMFIVRDMIYAGPVDHILQLRSSELEPNGQIVLPFNPEWVSIDIRLMQTSGMQTPITVSGSIQHQCVPEPATLVLVVFGALGLLLARRR
jgi:hypothetical protein